MSRVRTLSLGLCALLLCVGLAAPAFAQDSSGQEEQEPAEQEQEEEYRYEEVVVVTASRTEELLLEAPTAMTVISAADIEGSPAKNYADLLRGVPGLNVSQSSARDINLSSRSATSTLDASQLVLVDGRSVYQDWFGFVMWDLLPVDFSEVEQIEVIRGPGSAVWGANAMSGVVNVITKTPAQLGNAFRIKAGGGEQGTGYGSAIYSGVRDDWAYKFSGAYSTQEAWDRPGPLPNGTPRDSFRNEGTEQPKFDFRIDRTIDDRAYFSISGGYAGTGGIAHTGIGPFSVLEGSKMMYGRVDYNRDALNIRGFMNRMDGTGINLLNGLAFIFKTDTFNGSISNTSVLGDGAHVLAYGVNGRALSFDLSIAPAEDSRSEGGAYLQDSIAIGEQLTFNVGGRVDTFSVLDDPVFSPRVSVLFSPDPDASHVIRASFNRAYRAPSLINNFLDVSIFNAVTLPVVGQFVFASTVVGNPDLVEESLDQWEIGYRGIFADGRISVDLAAYQSEVVDSIDFYTSAVYTAFNPPAGWPLPAFFLSPFGPVLLPSDFSYRNIGSTKNKGIEVGFQSQPFRRNQFSANYSWQDTPEIEGVDPMEIGIPPEHRFNVAWNGWAGNWYYGAQVNYTSEAYWTDVLDSRFWGYTDAYTTVNASLGVLFLEGAAEASLRATNLLDEDVLQHIYGDVIGRRILGEVSFFLQ